MVKILQARSLNRNLKNSSEWSQVLPIKSFEALYPTLTSWDVNGNQPAISKKLNWTESGYSQMGRLLQNLRAEEL